MPSPVPGQHAEEGPQQQGNGNGDQAGQKIGLDPHDQPRQDIPAHKIRSQQVPAGTRRGQQEAEIHFLGIVGQKVERPQDVRYKHSKGDKKTVADIDEILLLRPFPERQV